MGRIARSWQLGKCSMAVLSRDKELVLLPVISGLCLLVVALSFLIPFGLLVDGDFENADDTSLGLLGLGFYIVSYTITFFFQAAVVAGASERMQGGDPTLGSSLSAAWERRGKILLWGVIAGTVGFVIKSIQERSELAGRIIMGLIGVAWSLATFFMVPVLVLEDHEMKPSFQRSWSIFKQTWGETVVGRGGIGLISFLLFFVVICLAGLIGFAGLEIMAVIVGVLGVLLVAALSSALQGIYVAALFRFATTGEIPSGFEGGDLNAVFAPKG